MTGRRTSTTTQPTPIEETEPTQPPPTPAPEPAEPDTGPQEPSGASSAHAFDRHNGTSRPNLGQFVAEVARSFPAAQVEDYPLTVGEAIAEVTRRIGAIEKTGRSTEGYRFRGIDQALAALHPILGDVGLVIVPGRVHREQWETRATAKGGTLNVARLLVGYTFIGPDGTRLRAAAWGEGADSGDKATQKAHSQSYKTLVFQTFTIPTEESAADEPDATGEAARPFTPDEIERAERAWVAAQEAADLIALVGIRRRAEHLLDVPIDGGSAAGTVAPLSYWFDQRRAVLEDATPGGGPR